MAKHRIHEQVLELTVRGAEAEARASIERLSQLQRARLEAVIARVLDECSPSGRVHRIEQLDLDLGTLPLDALESALPRALELALRRALRDAIASLDEDASAPAAGSRSALELLECFAWTGNLPWWADRTRPDLVAEALRGLADAGRSSLGALAGLRALLQAVEAVPGGVERLVRASDDALLEALAARLANDGSGLRAVAMVRALLAKSAADAATREALWARALTACAASKVDEGALALALSSAVSAAQPGWTPARLRAALAPLALPTTLLEALPEQSPASPRSDAEDPRARARALSEALLEHSGAARDEEDLAAASLRALQARAMQILAGGSDSPAPSSSQTPPPNLAAAARALAASLANPRLDVVDLRRHLSWLRSPLAEALPERLRADLLDALNTLLERASNPPAPPPRPPERVAKALAELPVWDAGLVILWPFLDRFMQRAGLLAADGRSFVDLRAQTRAVHLLHYCASAELGAPEHALPLAKLMAGLGPHDRLAALDPSDPAELDPALLDEADRMLAAVIAHAEILRQMPVDSLRASFLRRHGVLGERDGTWLLRVEAEPHDLVLDRFPWSWSWLTLPWMPAPLQVEW
ncbi:hypothetical protein G6O69_36045 [Pseudenhygromyxa sp. WMMC2535]|uniref:contractile injection system tape measure protein n=1 Tax=Pseudenhygromyxa sp. WMMC2535 TaxID=2712867 RepID=UPI001555BC30|nr:hypothetical protein [Pseudenhygromyxa sp. WMMC2535]